MGKLRFSKGKEGERRRIEERETLREEERQREALEWESIARECELRCREAARRFREENGESRAG